MSMMPIRGIIGGRRPTSASSLLTGLVSWWSMDETSGTRYDSHGSNDLTDNNTVGYTTGQVGNASSHIPGNTEYFSYTSTDHGIAGDNDWSLVGWVNANTFVAGFPAIMHVGTGNNANVSSMLVYVGSQKFGVGVADTAAWYTLDADTFGTLSSDTWYFLYASHETSTNTLRISVNNGTVDSTTYSGAVNAGTKPLYIGYYWGSGNLFSGRLDELAYYNRVLTTDEISELYNSGSGIGYPG